MIKIQLINTISSRGLDQFEKDRYEVSETIKNPDAMIVRSSDMHALSIPDSVKIIGRAGAGVNNIPIAALTQRGIPVINTPGANANAVMELVIAGMLLASRHLCQAWHYVEQLNVSSSDFIETIEKNKKRFVGRELVGKTLGIIGLGHVGVKTANAALAMGMKVIGFDPALSVNKAWELSPHVERAKDLNALLSHADFVSVHVPLIPKTREMINRDFFSKMKLDATLLNFSRLEIINLVDLMEVLNSNRLKTYVSDFPTHELHHHPKTIFLPHIGASTEEAEENCAVMLVRQMKAFFEKGAILDSVNFPTVEPVVLQGHSRIAISNLNVPNMLAQITHVLGSHGLNIIYFINQAREEIAYNIIDVDQTVSIHLLKDIAAIEGVIQVRQI